MMILFKNTLRQIQHVTVVYKLIIEIKSLLQEKMLQAGQSGVHNNL